MRLRDRLAVRVYGGLLLLVPAWLRRRSGAAMLELLETRLAATVGALEWARVWSHEVSGLLRVAVSARAGSGMAATAAVAARGESVVMERVVQDIRAAARTLRRAPGVALLAVLTLGLGIGATTAMFSVIHGVVLRGLPFDDPGRIVLVYPTIEEWRGNAALSAGADRGSFSYPELEAWRAQQQSFSAVAGYTRRDVRVPSGAGARHIGAAQADAGMWDVLRVSALYGRVYTAQEEDAAGVVVLTYRYWQTEFGGDAAVIGRDMQVNDRPVRVIGVLPRSFELPGVQAEVWQPLVVDESRRGINVHSLRAIGRLREGVSATQAEAELATIFRGINEEHPRHGLTHEARLVSPVEEAAGKYRTPLLILLSASVLLLVAACASVALLLLGAGADRVRELAVRGALGADRSRLAAQLLMESLVLGAAAAAAGVVLAGGLIRLLVYLTPPTMPRLDTIGVDWRTFAFTAAVAVISATLCGVFPAFSLSRVKAALSLRAGATTAHGGALQRGVVVVQLAVATMLLVGAGLLTRTMHELQSVSPGFDADGLLTVQLELPYDLMRGADGSWDAVPARIRSYAERITEAVGSLPGVEAIALTNVMPYSAGRTNTAVEPEDYVPAADEVVTAGRREVTANWFEVMRIPVLHGRGFTPDDVRDGAQPVIVVNERFARAFWPDGRWVGRRVTVWGTEHRVAGVSADIHEQDVRGDEDVLMLYTPARAGSVGSDYIIRTSLPPEQLVAAVRQRIMEVDRSLVIGGIAPMRERISGTLAEYRYRMLLMMAFSVIAAIFALLGVYGVTSRAVARRRQELGVRIALGAQRRDIVSLVLGDGLRISVFGSFAGLAGAVAAVRILESVLWGVPRTDALTFTAVAAALLLLALLATLAPALRAARVEPISILKG